MGFLNNLSATKIGSSQWLRLDHPLMYQSEKLNRVIAVPAGFVCDKESIGRWLGVAYILLANTSERGGVLHDYLYRYDSEPSLTRAMADEIYREACLLAGNSKWKAYSKWLGVRLGGRWSYHKKSVTWKPED